MSDEDYIIRQRRQYVLAVALGILTAIVCHSLLGSGPS